MLKRKDGTDWRGKVRVEPVGESADVPSLQRSPSFGCECASFKLGMLEQNVTFSTAPSIHFLPV